MKKTINTLKTVNHDLELRTFGVYHIPCECGKAYVGHTSRTIEIRCHKHIKHLYHVQSETSAIAENTINIGHEIQFEKKHIYWPGQPPTWTDQ
jgi:hypothetical protein